MLNKTAVIIRILVAAALGLAGVARADAGRETFEKKCASCHGKDGNGKTPMGEKLHIQPFSKTPQDLTVGQVQAIVNNGIPDKKMPAFGEKLEAEEIAGVARYIEATFGKPSAEAPAAEEKKAEEKKTEEKKAEEKKTEEKKTEEKKTEEGAKATKATKAKAKKPAKKRTAKAKKAAPDAGAPAAPPAP